MINIDVTVHGWPESVKKINIRREIMVKIKSFTSEIKVFQTKRELDQLDDQVNRFIEDNHVSKVISVSDSCTTDTAGSTIGVIRVIAYDDGK
jgi:hypothetical protein